MSKKYSTYIPCSGKLEKVYKDKFGVLILYYIDQTLGKWVFIDPMYRKKNRLSENQKKYKFDYLGGTANFYVSDSMDFNYQDCLWVLRKNSRAKRWFKKLIEENFGEGI